MSHDEAAYYLYCLTPAAVGLPLTAAGVDGNASVYGEVCGEFGAVCSRVRLDEFCGEEAEERLQDLAWLGPRAYRHEAVIEEVMERMPVLPAGFGTLFTSLDSLRQTVLERSDRVAGFFAQLGRRQEWSVKGILDRAEAWEKRDLSGQLTEVAASPGARYMQEKRLRAQWERDFQGRLKEFRRGAAAVLAAEAPDFRERKVQAAADEDAGSETVWNWAYLLRPEDLDRFRASLEELNSAGAFPGLRVTLTGPWPPYSFVPDLTAGDGA